MRRYKIGRSETNEIVIADASISRQHAELAELGEGRFSLTDLGSTYGTKVWQDQGWVAAAETEIRPDTALLFGEFQTTLMDVLSAAQRETLGLLPQKAPAPSAPVAAPPFVPAAPSVPRTEERRPPVAEAPPSPRVAAKPRAMPAASRQRSMMMGLLGLGLFVGLAAVAIAVIVMFGDANPAPRPDTPGRTASEAQARFLDSCTKEWGVEERRCRCFLAAAGPHLQDDDYDDLAEMAEAYVSGDTDRQESALQRATEKRGAPANSRLTAAFKGVVRDCQQ
ncbi:MAG: FHA domain-containing protein [Alphaproteobacteria bacterium]